MSLFCLEITRSVKRGDYSTEFKSITAPTILKTTNTTRYPNLCLPLTQHGLGVCQRCCGEIDVYLPKWQLAVCSFNWTEPVMDNPQIADYYTDVAHTALSDTRPLCLVAHTRYNYPRQTVQARLLASFSRTSSQSRREEGHSHS